MLITVGLVIVAAAYFVAFIVFRPAPAGGPLSWGSFGNYFGGVAGPLVALAALWFVYRTLQTTRKQLDALERQLEMAHATARFADITTRLDAVLAEWNRCIDNRTAPVLSGEASLRDVFYTDAGWSGFEAKHHSNGDDIADVLRQRAPEVPGLLEEFEQYCDEYDRLADDRVTTNFYRNRLEPALARIARVNDVLQWRIESLRGPTRLFPQGLSTGTRAEATITTVGEPGITSSRTDR